MNSFYILLPITVATSFYDFIYKFHLIATLFFLNCCHIKLNRVLNKLLSDDHKGHHHKNYSIFRGNFEFWMKGERKIYGLFIIFSFSFSFLLIRNLSPRFIFRAQSAEKYIAETFLWHVFCEKLLWNFWLFAYHCWNYKSLKFTTRWCLSDA